MIIIVHMYFFHLQLFKKLFKQGLDIQKERVRELMKYTADKREERTKKQQEELQALEN